MAKFFLINKFIIFEVEIFFLYNYIKKNYFLFFILV